MLKLPEIKKLIKTVINDKCLWLVKADLIVERVTYGMADVKIQLGYKQYSIGTFNLLNEQAKLEEKQFKAVEKFVDKVYNSLVNVEEMEIRVISNLREEYEL